MLDSYPDTPVCDDAGLLRWPPAFNQVAIERWQKTPEKFSFQRIPLANLGKYRNIREAKKVESLKAHMKAGGAIPPIYLKTSLPIINNGNHRVQAARELGFTHIWAVVEDTGPPVQGGLVLPGPMIRG